MAFQALQLPSFFTDLKIALLQIKGNIVTSFNSDTLHKNKISPTVIVTVIKRFLEEIYYSLFFESIF